MGTKRAIQYWVIPPEADAEFVAHMEDVLDVYSRPYDANVPVLCMDEQPVQLVEEVKQPIKATKKHPLRVDYEYKRAGVANIFMFAEPLAGWRHVSVRERKTKVDWAIEMAGLLEGRYADCEKVIVVCDNLNTHTMGAFSRFRMLVTAGTTVSKGPRTLPEKRSSQFQHGFDSPEFASALVGAGRHFQIRGITASACRRP